MFFCFGICSGIDVVAFLSLCLLWDISRNSHRARVCVGRNVTSAHSRHTKKNSIDFLFHILAQFHRTLSAWMSTNPFPDQDVNCLLFITCVSMRQKKRFIIFRFLFYFGFFILSYFINCGQLILKEAEEKKQAKINCLPFVFCDRKINVTNKIASVAIVWAMSVRV